MSKKVRPDLVSMLRGGNLTDLIKNSLKTNLRTTEVIPDYTSQSDNNRLYKFLKIQLSEEVKLPGNPVCVYLFDHHKKLFCNENPDPSIPDIEASDYETLPRPVKHPKLNLKTNVVNEQFYRCDFNINEGKFKNKQDKKGRLFLSENGILHADINASKNICILGKYNEIYRFNKYSFDIEMRGRKMLNPSGKF